jgi:hypothetical protein
MSDARIRLYEKLLRMRRLYELRWELHWLLVAKVRAELGMPYWWPSDADFKDLLW